MSTRVGDHVVVLGGSIAGLLAARVLSETYGRVTLVERDRLPAGPFHRRGVPQARHVHGLLPRGCCLLEELFEGLTRELLAAGALAGDSLANIRWLISGQRLAQTSSGAPGLFLSRPLLEDGIRRRIRQIPNVAVLDGHLATGVVTTHDRRRVTGVEVQAADASSHPFTLNAALVVDATGRGSRTPRWLVQLGYSRPERDQVIVGIRYASRVFRLRPGALGQDLLVITNSIPGHPRSGVLEAIEGGRHLATMAGVLGDTPPVDLAGFLAFSRSLAFPDIHDAISGATPLDDGAGFGYPANLRVRYERMKSFPAGLLVFGDAVCSLNPIYGEGMTVAALQAVILRRLLAAAGEPRARRYFREIARVTDVPWEGAVSNDLANPLIIGKRTWRMRLANAYVPRLHAAAANDARLARAFVRVSGLLEPPHTLMRPDRVVQVLASMARAHGVPRRARG